MPSPRRMVSPPHSCCNDQPCAQPLPSRPHHSRGSGPMTWQASWAFGVLPRDTLNSPNSFFCAAEPCWLLMLCKEPSARESEKCMFCLSSSSLALGYYLLFHKSIRSLKTGLTCDMPFPGLAISNGTAWPGCQPPFLFCFVVTARPVVPTPRGSPRPHSGLTHLPSVSLLSVLSSKTRLIKEMIWKWPTCAPIQERKEHPLTGNTQMLNISL